MFNRREPAHLLPLDEAKKLFKSALAPRIETYENRLKKPWLEQRIEYLQTGFGEAGYDRTKDFLAAIDEENISRTERLIDLTKRDKYQKGHALPLLLKKIVLKVCGFREEHVKEIEDELNVQILAGSANSFVDVYRMMTVREEAIETIYNKIIKHGGDYGESYLRNFPTRGLSSSFRPA